MWKILLIALLAAGFTATKENEDTTTTGAELSMKMNDQANELEDVDDSEEDDQEEGDEMSKDDELGYSTVQMDPKRLRINFCTRTEKRACTRKRKRRNFLRRKRKRRARCGPKRVPFCVRKRVKIDLLRP